MVSDRLHESNGDDGLSLYSSAAVKRMTFDDKSQKPTRTKIKVQSQEV